MFIFLPILLPRRYFRGDKMKKLLKLFTIGIFGGICYGCIEMLKRGYSHISMGLLGAISMIVIHELNGERRAGRMTCIGVLFRSMLFITSGELLAGEILNRQMGMKIWNYHNIPFNFDGQICLRYSAVWFILSFFGMVSDNFIRRFIFCELTTDHKQSTKII